MNQKFVKRPETVHTTAVLGSASVWTGTWTSKKTKQLEPLMTTNRLRINMKMFLNNIYMLLVFIRKFNINAWWQNFQIKWQQVLAICHNIVLGKKNFNFSSDFLFQIYSFYTILRVCFKYSDNERRGNY